MQKLISVIVPIYKVETYLDRCIQSIKEQTYRNLEIILVDDGSPDCCGEICDRYATEDSRIKVIHKVNGGLSDARNAGIEIAEGDYIAFVDSDDWIHKQMLELLIKAIERDGSEIAICSYQTVYDDKRYEDIYYQGDGAINTLTVVNQTDSQYDYFVKTDRREIYTVAWNKLYHRRLFENIRYPKGKVHEDEYTTFKLLYEAKGIVWIKLPLYYYVQRSNSIMGEFRASRFDIFDGYLEKICFYQEHNEDELVCMTLFHGMHMLAQYQQWTKEARADFKEQISFYRTRMLEVSRTSKGRMSLNVKQCVELLLFRCSFGMYYRIWKKMKVH